MQNIRDDIARLSERMNEGFAELRSYVDLGFKVIETEITVIKQDTTVVKRELGVLARALLRLADSVEQRLASHDDAIAELRQWIERHDATTPA